MQGLTCHGCGSTDILFDPATRKIHCSQCGREEYYSRAQLGATGKVALAKDNALRFFKEGNRDRARTFAGDVLNTMQDNAAALFIMAYCDEFVESRNGAIKGFFQRLDPIALEYDEVRDLKDLFSASIYNLRDYEADMVSLVVKNMQSPKDRDELEIWIDTICSYCIGKYPSADFLTEERVALYCDLASNCNIPKTCFALLKGVKTNPDSPYTTNSFYMKAKTAYFHDHYVVPIGRIISAMQDKPYSQKFSSAYETTQKQFDIDAQSA